MSITSPFGLNALESIAGNFAKSSKLPVVFIGHGSPMNAIQQNPFTETLRKWGESIEKPQAILMVSAHWITMHNTKISVNPNPETIYDFGGFPPALSQVKYPAPGHPVLARETAAMVSSIKIHENHEQGLDHGAWTILKHIFPKADVPCFQLSIDYAAPPAKHFELAAQLKKLREKGVLIMGSGNVVHNLREVNFNSPNPAPYDYTVEFDSFVKKNLESGDYMQLVNFQQNANLAIKAHPTHDHYLPLLYTLGAADKGEKLNTIFEELQVSSISMRSFVLG